MPQLHHRDPSIIGLLGASPHLSSPFSPSTTVSPLFTPRIKPNAPKTPSGSEAFEWYETPPPTAISKARSELHLDRGHVADMSFERPFYGMIVDGIHSHPNSVRVGLFRLDHLCNSLCLFCELAYSAHPEGCILITDG